jgi:hypothetical protein
MASVVLVGFALSACGGSNPSAVPSGGNSIPNAKFQPNAGAAALAAQSIAIADSLGAPIKGMGDAEREISPVAVSGSSTRRHPKVLPLGVCTNGVIFNAPDTNGDANSTEYLYYFDNACTTVARTITRQFNNAGGTGSETVYNTMRLYGQPAGKKGIQPILAVRSDVVNLSNGSYDQYGFPDAGAGAITPSATSRPA